MNEDAHSSWATTVGIVAIIIALLVSYNAWQNRQERLIKGCVESGGTPIIPADGDPTFRGCTPKEAR